MFTAKSSPAVIAAVQHRVGRLPRRAVEKMLTDLIRYDVDRLSAALTEMHVPVLAIQATYSNESQERRSMAKGQTTPYLDMLRTRVPSVRIEIIDPRDIDARYCLRSYFEELGHRFDTGFDPAQSISASDEEMTLPNGLLLVANLLGAAVGCGALKLHIDTQIAEVKRMWVASDVRGLGLGRRLLERLSAEAASRGMVILRLETNRSLSEAKHLYERAGFVEVEPFNNEPYAHHWFQKDLRHK